MDPSLQEEVEKVEEKIKTKIAAITPIEARNIVKESGVMLCQGWNLTSSITLDAIKKDPEASISKEHFDN